MDLPMAGGFVSGTWHIIKRPLKTDFEGIEGFVCNDSGNTRIELPPHNDSLYADLRLEAPDTKTSRKFPIVDNILARFTPFEIYENMIIMDFVSQDGHRREDATGLNVYRVNLTSGVLTQLHSLVALHEHKTGLNPKSELEVYALEADGRNAAVYQYQIFKKDSQELLKRITIKPFEIEFYTPKAGAGTCNTAVVATQPVHPADVGDEDIYIYIP